jgi:hypothetical protein
MILFTALFASVMSCSGQQLQKRTLPPFSKIQASGIVKVIYTDSDSIEVRVEARPGDMDQVETKVENGTLVIYSKGKVNGDVNIYVSNNHLNGVELSGVAEFRSTNTLKPDSIKFNASGASQLNAKIQSFRISCVQSGASNLELSGTANELDADLTGAGNLKSYNLMVQTASVTTTGAATAKVNISGTINANASGASSVKIKGDPKQIVAEASAASSVSKIKEKNEQRDDDTTTYKWRGKKIIVIDTDGDEKEKMKRKHSHSDNRFKHWKGISVAVNGYLNPAGALNPGKQYNYLDLNYSRSFNWQLNLLEKHINIVRNHVKLVTGFGIDFHMYELARRTTLQADSSFTWGTIDSTNNYTYLKNKLRATYLQVPLLVEFNTSNHPEKAFHIAIGVIGQYLVASRTKQVLEQDGTDLKKIKKDNYNLSPFAAKAHVNLGYRSWTIFGEYSLTSLFKSGMGPELYPFAAGVRVIPFG